MPKPPQINCRHGSQESLHNPVLQEMFRHHPFDNSSCQGIQSASAELKPADCCVRDHAERVAFHHCRTPPLVLLQVMGCPARQHSAKKEYLVAQSNQSFRASVARHEKWFVWVCVIGDSPHTKESCTRNHGHHEENTLRTTHQEAETHAKSQARPNARRYSHVISPRTNTTHTLT